MNNQPNPNSNPSLKAHKPHPTSKTPNQPLFAQSVPNNMVSEVPMLSNPRYPNTGLYPPVYVPTPPDYSFRQMYPGPNMSQPTANDSFTYNDDEPLDEKKQPTVAPKDTNNQEQPKNLEDIIELSMKIKKKTLYSSSFNEQTLPFLVSLKAGTLKNDAKVPIDLICVIDHSGSMSGEKIELVKNTFNFLLEYMDSSDRLSIVIFDNQASRIVPLLRTTPENKIKVLAALKDVHGRGGTDINLGITHACQILKQRRYNNPVSSIFLLSDGLDGGAQDKIKATLTQLKIPEDITINTFGYGRDHDPQLMTDIANLRDGGFYFIDKLDQVDEAFVDCWGGLINSVAQNAEITVKPEQSEVLKGVQILKAYGDASMWTHWGKGYTTKMASVMGTKQKDYVLEIKIPKNTNELLDHQKSICIASAEATLTGLDGKKVVKKAELFITLLNETEEVKEEEGDDREVMQNFYRVKSGELLEEARKLADQRKNEEAKKLLQGFREEVANSFLKDVDFIKNLVKDLDKALQYVTPQVYNDYGRQTIVSHQRSHMQQRVDLNANTNYQIPSQQAMTDYVRAQKPQN